MTHRLLAPGEVRSLILDAGRLPDWQRRSDRLLHAEGAGHLVHGLPLRADGRAASIESRPWRLDPIPVLLEAPTFAWLADAVAERMRAIDAVIADIYGQGDLVAARIVDSAALSASSGFRLGAVDTRPHRWLSSYGAELVLGANGVWYLSRDLTDAPSGLGYALLGRSVMGRVMPDIVGAAGIAPMSRTVDRLRAALAATTDVSSPRIVLFTSGLDHPTYVDHSYLAVELGVHLVEGADLVMREGRVWLRTLTGLEPVDVLYRRLEDPRVDPLEVESMGGDGVPALIQAVRSGGVALANAHGSGVAESADLQALIDAALEHRGGLTNTLPRWPGPSVPLATYPTLVDDGVVERNVVLRLFASDDGDSVWVARGGVGRVLNPGDDLNDPTSALVKDIWVLGGDQHRPPSHRLPQVDLRGSLPTRAASALYWANRAAERAETIARLSRVIRSRVEFDPDIITLDGGVLASAVGQLAGAVGRMPVPDGPGPGDDGSAYVEQILGLLSHALHDRLGALLGEALTVREYLSATTGRSLARLADRRPAAQAGPMTVDELDSILGEFAAFVGLWHESTVRGPAWQIGDTGRRLERCRTILNTLNAVFTGTSDDSPTGVVLADAQLSEEARDWLIEVVLAANESLVTYRRRYRSDVEPEATVDLLVLDESNPRSLAAALAEIDRSAHASDWTRGQEIISDATAALELRYADLLAAVDANIVAADQAIVARWFSAPVAPIAMRRTVGDA